MDGRVVAAELGWVLSRWTHGGPIERPKVLICMLSLIFRFLGRRHHPAGLTGHP